MRRILSVFGLICDLPWLWEKEMVISRISSIVYSLYKSEYRIAIKSFPDLLLYPLPLFDRTVLKELHIRSSICLSVKTPKMRSTFENNHLIMRNCTRKIRQIYLGILAAHNSELKSNESNRMDGLTPLKSDIQSIWYWWKVVLNNYRQTRV